MIIFISFAIIFFLSIRKAIYYHYYFLLMIGFFDSGFWGLKTMKYFYDLYPDYDYIFLADNQNCPFGNKSWDEIEKITFKSLNWLFDNWADIVIIACNTAAAYSIRKRQNLYPNKKTLSITVPWVEEIIQTSHTNHQKTKKQSSFGVLATQATVRSDIYVDLYSRFWWKWDPDFNFVMAPKLVEMVESWVKDRAKIILAIQEYLAQFPKNISTLVLWCTHFSVYKPYFEELFDGVVIDPSFYSAQKFWDYLKNHPEVDSKLWLNSNVSFYTTWDVENFSKIWSNICQQNLKANQISI